MLHNVCKPDPKPVADPATTLTRPSVANGQAAQLEFGGGDAGVGVGAWSKVSSPPDMAWMLRVHESGACVRAPAERGRWERFKVKAASAERGQLSRSESLH